MFEDYKLKSSFNQSSFFFKQVCFLSEIYASFNDCLENADYFGEVQLLPLSIYAYKIKLRFRASAIPKKNVYLSTQDDPQYLRAGWHLLRAEQHYRRRNGTWRGHDACVGRRWAVTYDQQPSA